MKVFWFAITSVQVVRDCQLFASSSALVFRDVMTLHSPRVVA
jgi:hypothetical protein